MKKFFCFLILVFVLASTPAFSSDLTLFGGVQRAGKITLQNSASAVPSLITFNPKNFGTFGIRAGVGKQVVGTETTFAYSSNMIDSGVRAVILNQNLNVQLPLPKVKPYASVGLGSVFTKGTGTLDIGSKFAINYGGGLKFFPVGGPVGGRIDVRNYTLPSVQSQTLNMFEVSVGVVFSF